MNLPFGRGPIGTTATAGPGPPLFVDLDGSLLATDVLWESLLALKSQPLTLLLLPIWLFRGKARFKSEIARRVTLDVAQLPYRQDVLAFLWEEPAWSPPARNPPRSAPR